METDIDAILMGISGVSFSLVYTCICQPIPTLPSRRSSRLQTNIGSSYTENDIGVNAAAATMLSVTPNPFPLASKPYKNTIMYKPEVLIT